MVYSGQNIVNHYLIVFGKIVDEVVVRGLCNVFQKLMKVAFKNLYLMIPLLQNSSFDLLKTFIYCALCGHFI